MLHKEVDARLGAPAGFAEDDDPQRDGAVRQGVQIPVGEAARLRERIRVWSGHRAPAAGVVTESIFDDEVIEVRGRPGLAQYLNRPGGEGRAFGGIRKGEEGMRRVFRAVGGGRPRDGRGDVVRRRPRLPVRVLGEPFLRGGIGHGDDGLLLIEQAIVLIILRTLRRQAQAGEGINEDLLPQVAFFGQWPVAEGEEFNALRLRRAKFTRLRARDAADRFLHDRLRAREGRGLAATERPFHEILPDGRGPAHAGRVHHRREVRVSHPHARHEVRGVADRPVVAEVVGRPGLDRRRERQQQWRIGAEGRRARGVVGEDVADEEGGLRRDDLLIPVVRRSLARRRIRFDLARRERLLADDFAVEVGDLVDGDGEYALAAVGERAVRADHLQEGDFAAAQRQ